ncbi:MAG TPA: hypothetical protein DCR55_12615 [Lentisphaeria bacterium]|nr:hypothetical protein [Lentisphaeria bacterium]
MVATCLLQGGCLRVDFNLLVPVEPAVGAMEQLSFDVTLFSADSANLSAHLSRGKLRQGVLAWVAAQGADAIGLDVVTRNQRFRAPIGAFWSSPAQLAAKSMLVEIKTSRAACWPDHVRSENLLPELRSLKRDRQTLLAEIRDAEPHLRCSQSLFEEFAEWNYEKSDNPAYQQLSEDIRRVQTAIYRGTRFERLAAGTMAHKLYLAVPEGAVHPDELADGWGLLWVHEDQSVTCVADATHHTCPQDDVNRFAVAIAKSAKACVLFATGIDEAHACRIVQPPRRRRKPQ